MAILSNAADSSTQNLTTIAAAINEEHALAEQYASMAIHRARRAGELLNQAKAQVPHGQWLPWLASHCPKISTRRAQEYMRVVREWPTIQAKYADSAHLTIDAVLTILAEPKMQSLPLSEPIESERQAIQEAPPPDQLPAPSPEKQDQLFSSLLVEEINLAHRLSRTKAEEAKRHMLELGGMLIKLKASMSAEQWDAWIIEQQQGGIISGYDARKAISLAEETSRAAKDLTERLKTFRLCEHRESLLMALATPEQAREVRQHWLVEESDYAQEWVDRTVKELRADQDMPNWLKSDSLTRALERAERAKRKVEGRSLELTDTETHALWEQAKAMLAATEGSAL